jgi:WD40 repeat protein
MAEGPLESSGAAASANEIQIQPTPARSPVLGYRSPQPGLGIRGVLRGLPHPSKITLIVLLLTIGAGCWLKSDHAAWVIVRQFDGTLPEWSAPNLAISPDGKRVLTVLGDHETLRIYDLATGTILRDLHRPLGYTRTAAFSPDGTGIWSTGTEQAILWDAANGQIVAWQTPDKFGLGFDWYGTMSASPFSPDGRFLAESDRPALLILDGQSAAMITQLAASYFPRFSSDGRYLAALSSPPSQVLIWQTQTWRQVAAFSIDAGNGDNGIPAEKGDYLAFTPDGKKLAVGFGNVVDLWDSATNQVSPAITLGQPVKDLSFSPDGHYLMTADGATCQTWDMSTHKSLGIMASNYDMPVISPDGARAVGWGGTAGDGGICSFPSLVPLERFSSGSRTTAWIPGQRAFVTDDNHNRINLFRQRRPDSILGIAWLPQFWTMILGIAVSIRLIHRDLQSWKLSPPAS